MHPRSEPLGIDCVDVSVIPASPGVSGKGRGWRYRGVSIGRNRLLPASKEDPFTGKSEEHRATTRNQRTPSRGRWHAQILPLPLERVKQRL
jgi:hypothetical protein